MSAPRAVIGGQLRHLGAWRPSRLRLRSVKPAVELAQLPAVHTIDGFPTDYDQGSLGSCGPNSAAEVYEFNLHQKFARLWLYYFTRSVEDDTGDDAGVEIPDMFGVLHTMGMPLETSWPYDITKYDHIPPLTSMREALGFRLLQWDPIAGLEHLLFELANNYPVTCGFQVPASMMDGAGGTTATTGLVPVPSEANPSVGGHCVNLIGYDRPRQLLKATCHYGPAFGDHGCIWLPFAHVTGGNACDLSAMRRIE